MSKPQVNFSLQLGSRWDIRRPYVYRYLPKTYADRFFEDGSIRLSSFKAFSKHADEERLDKQEGWGVVSNISSEGTGQSIFARIGQGHNTYVLCGSTIFSDEISKAFKTDSGFRINDPTAFGAEIARQLPGFQGGREGACIYADKRVVNRRAGKVDLEEMKIDPDGKDLDMDKMMNSIFGLAGDDLYFLKLLEYQHQAEYRLLWAVDGKPKDFIDLKCPKAIQYCTRFEDLSSPEK